MVALDEKSEDQERQCDNMSSSGCQESIQTFCWIGEEFGLLKSQGITKLTCIFIKGTEIFV